jgi:hypothetical protein
MSSSLFGGAIEVSFSESLVDVSKLREVPDNQEVFLRIQEDVVDKQVLREQMILQSSLSLIIEILEFDTSGDNALLVIFQDIIESNDAIEFKVVSTTSLDIQSNIPKLAANVSKQSIEGLECFQLVGLQRVPSKSRTISGAVDFLLVLLTVIRLPSVGTDIAVTVNAPLRIILPESTESLDFIENDAKTRHEAEQLMTSVLQNFQIKDWSLFL